MKRNGSLIYLLGFIIVISAAILVTSLGQDKDTAIKNNNGENVQAEANIETPTETEDENSEDAAAEGTESDGGLLAQGEKIVMQKCIACHGGDLSGGRGPNLQTVGSRLTEDDILAVLKDGNKTMPPNLLKSDEDTAAAAKYLSTLK